MIVFNASTAFYPVERRIFSDAHLIKVSAGLVTNIKIATTAENRSRSHSPQLVAMFLDAEWVPELVSTTRQEIISLDMENLSSV